MWLISILLLFDSDVYEKPFFELNAMEVSHIDIGPPRSQDFSTSDSDGQDRLVIGELQRFDWIIFSQLVLPDFEASFDCLHFTRRGYDCALF
jgi:hypothetical protein